MKKQFVSALIIIAVSAPAFATTYQTICSPTVCGANSPPPGPTWTSAAVTYASGLSVNVGDTVALCQNRPNGSSHGDTWEVTTAPVTNSSDLTFSGVFGDPDFPC